MALLLFVCSSLAVEGFSFSFLSLSLSLSLMRVSITG